MKPRKFSSLRPLPLELDLSDLEETLVYHSGGIQLFGNVPIPQVMRDLEERGIVEELKGRGYTDFQPLLERPDPYQERFRITAHHPRASERVTLMDMRAHRGELVIEPHPPMVALVWDWIQLQDPTQVFGDRHPPLPGQEHPGLGLFRKMTELMMVYVHGASVDALVAVPEFYHNAVLYGPHFFFLDAAHEGWFRALRRDLSGLSLHEASFAVEEGRVLDSETGQPAEWTPFEQVHPMAPALTTHFQSECYLGLVQAAEEKNRFQYSNGGLSPAEPGPFAERPSFPRTL